MAIPEEKKSVDSEGTMERSDAEAKGSLAPKAFSWGTPAKVQEVVQRKTLAEIMAEESETRMAGLAVYETELSLADMEAEQARLLQSFQETISEQQVPPPSSNGDYAFSQRALQEIERSTGVVVVEGPHSTEEERRRQSAIAASTRPPPKRQSDQVSRPSNDLPVDFLQEARKHLSDQELEEIERALQEADLENDASSPTHVTTPEETCISEEEAAIIAAALREADAKQEEESLMLALQIQQEELDYLHKNGRHLRSEYDDEDDDPMDETVGFRMNASSEQKWVRRDRNTIVGPNNEIRTKHDVRVQGQANAQYLGLEEDDYGFRAHVGNQAFNSFKNNMKRTTKGVATHGTGRAGTDTDAVRGKAMDSHVRLQITKAINSGLIEHCNGAVKQGKEAVIYHADQGAESQGHDVAVKIFKRITEFRGRGVYVNGDPRYVGQAFRNSSEREQLELWAEKEFRNLTRANRSRVPVPTPLLVKENIIFMRFIGNDGWPAPQLREIEMRQGNKKWEILYTQVMEAIRRLFTGARLVHGDLSEYNILVAPTFQVDHPTSPADDLENDLQTVLIDFGQAVDVRHPEAMSFLRRDLDRVRTFFMKQGVETLSIEDALQFVQDETRNDDAVDMQANAATSAVEAMS